MWAERIAGAPNLLWRARKGFSEETRSKSSPKDEKEIARGRWDGERQGKPSGQKELFRKALELLVAG